MERPLGARDKDMSTLNVLPAGPALDCGGPHSHDTLYQVTVQCTERGNRVILRLNDFQRQRYCNPASFGPMSKDEAEEPMPMHLGLLDGELIPGELTNTGVTDVCMTITS